MKLLIENIGKLNKANIELNGITVIAGENNAGKSTVGKALFAVTEVLYNYNEYVESTVKDALRKIITDYGKQLELLCSEYFELEGRFRRKPAKIEKIENRCISVLCKDFNERKNTNIDKHLQEYTQRYIETYRCNIEKCLNEAEVRKERAKNRLLDLWEVQENELGAEKATKVFGQVFGYQINKLQKLSHEGKVLVEDDYGKESEIVFIENKCVSLNYKTPIMERAYFIENSRCMDMVNEVPLFYRFLKEPVKEKLSIFKKYFAEINLRQMLCPQGIYTSFGWGSAVNAESVLANEEDDSNDLEITAMQKKFDKVLHLIREAIPGECKYKSGKIQYWEQGSDKPIMLPNLSTGLKSMILLESLISLGMLTTDSILILDEPEINLHPEWQLLYAQIIVELQRALDIKILLTTHSPYFLKAIKSYAIQGNTIDKCKFYLAENIDDDTEITDFTKNTNVIFRTLAEPLRKLKQMEYEEEE